MSYTVWKGSGFPHIPRSPHSWFTVIVCNVPIIYMLWFSIFIINHFFCLLYPILHMPWVTTSCFSCVHTFILGSISAVCNTTDLLMTTVKEDRGWHLPVLRLALRLGRQQAENWFTLPRPQMFSLAKSPSFSTLMLTQSPIPEVQVVYYT